MITTRRRFLKHVSGIGGAVIATTFFDPTFISKIEAAVTKIAHLPPEQVAQNEDFWYTVQQAYTASTNIINLNNGGVSPQPLVVQDALDRYNRISNEGPAYFMWRVLGQGRETIRTKLAKLAGCSPEEIAINRNTTEALETIIFGLNLNPGDEVLTTNQDYPSMLKAWRQREKRDGVKLKTISLPVPPEDIQEITHLFEKAITKKTKIIMICHIIFMTGQILPVREICDMAHKRGIEVIVDAAHSFAHLDYKIPDLHCDYFGTSLHKWLSAPFGTGMLYVKKEKIKKIWPLFATDNPHSDDIRKFEALGTRSFPAELAIGHAINFHNGIGGKRKEERLRFLKNYWANKITALPKVHLNTSLQPEQSCGLANFKIDGVEPHEIVNRLLKKYRIYVTQMIHDEFKGVRVTPHVYTTLQDLDLLVEAVGQIIKGTSHL